MCDTFCHHRQSEVAGCVTHDKERDGQLLSLSLYIYISVSAHACAQEERAARLGRGTKAEVTGMSSAPVPPAGCFCLAQPARRGAGLWEQPGASPG